MYYVCRVVDFPKLTPEGLTNEILLEFVDCQVPTLNPGIFNRAFSKREAAEDFVKNIGPSSVTYVVVYEPKGRSPYNG